MKYLYEIKARKIKKLISSHLGKKIIDIGSGKGYIAKELNLDVTCIDIKRLKNIVSNVMVYNGNHIPFRDDEFDTVLLIYVLHHTENHERILLEAKRICSGKIIIFEDTNPSLFTKIMDLLFNKFKGVAVPFNLHSKQEWINTFKFLDLKIIETKENVEREWFYPFVEHTMFVLRK